jgi:cobyric acid synthase
VWGTYIHDGFEAPGFRREFLNQLSWLGAAATAKRFVQGSSLDSLADLVSDGLDCEMLNRILAGTI